MNNIRYNPTNSLTSTAHRRLALIHNHLNTNKTAVVPKVYPEVKLADICGEQLEKQIEGMKEPNKEVIRLARRLFIEFMQVKDTSTWSLEKEKDGGSLYSSINKDSGIKVIFRKIHFKAPIKKVASFFKDSDIMFRMNDNISKCDLVEDIGMETKSYYHVMKGNMLVSDRDLSVVRHCFFLPDGRFTSVSFSKEIILDNVNIPPQARNDKVLLPVPQHKKRVRALIGLSVYLITPISETECLCESIQDGDPKGNVPTMLVNNRASKQLDTLIKCRNYLEK